MTRRVLTALALAGVLWPAPAFSNHPISVAFLVDVTFSATRDHLASEGRYEAAMRAVANHFQPGDSAVVGLVTSRLRLAAANRSSGKELTSDWRDLLAFPPGERFGPSPLFDALDAAATALRTLPGTRAVVLWTDGRPTGNVLGAEDAGARAAAAGVSLNVIVDDNMWVVDPKRGPVKNEKPCQVFDATTRMTGGTCLANSHGSSAPVKQLEQILEQLRNR